MKKVEFQNQKQRSLRSALVEEVLGMTPSLVRHMLKRKDVLVDGVRQNEDVELLGGEVVRCFFDENQLKKKFEIVFEDDNVLIVKKEAGIEVCDGEDNVERTLCREGRACKAVHRLDRNTEGLVIFSKNDTVEQILVDAIKDKTQITKTYLCEVVGRVSFEKLVDQKYLVKDKTKSVVKIFSHEVENSKPIKTGFEVVEKREATTILRVTLYTGRTHQIRAHLSYLGFPVVGDGKYGDYKFNRENGAKIQHLTAAKLEFALKNPKLSYLNKMSFETTPTWLC